MTRSNAAAAGVVIGCACLLIVLFVVIIRERDSGNQQSRYRAILSELESDPHRARVILDNARKEYNEPDGKYLVYKIGETEVDGVMSELVREWCYFEDKGWDEGTRLLHAYRVKKRDGSVVTLHQWVADTRRPNDRFEDGWVQFNARLEYVAPEADSDGPRYYLRWRERLE